MIKILIALNIILPVIGLFLFKKSYTSDVDSYNQKDDFQIIMNPFFIRITLVMILCYVLPVLVSSFSFRMCMDNELIPLILSTLFDVFLLIVLSIIFLIRYLKDIKIFKERRAKIKKEYKPLDIVMRIIWGIIALVWLIYLMKHY